MSALPLSTSSTCSITVASVVSRRIPRRYTPPNRQACQHFRHLSTAPGSKEQARKQAATSRIKLLIGYYVVFSALAGLSYEYVYNPLKQRGVFDAIKDNTIYRVYGIKSRSTPGPQLYQPLSRPGEIRLLLLSPGRDSDPVTCSRVNVDVNSRRTRYDALSYTWGNPTDVDTIMCCEQPRTVARNLHGALKHLRHAERPRMLWVDALCISQDDMDERQEQVKQMGLIFSRARQVLVWLGEAPPNNQNPLSVFRELEIAFRAVHRRRFLSNISRAEPLVYALLPCNRQATKLVDWAAAFSVLERPYFQRTWVMQEVALGKRVTVICGHDSMPWRTFEHVCLGMMAYQRNVDPSIAILQSPTVKEALGTIYMIHNIRKDQKSWSFSRRFWKPTSSLLDIIHCTRTLRCSDQRDKIFGILSMASDADPTEPLLSPNYSLTTAEVFKRATIWDIKHSKKLRMLSCASSKKDSDYKLPSWVPDFTRLEAHQSVIRLEKRFDFNAGMLPLTDGVRFSDDGNILILKGIEIDKIGRVATLEFPESLRLSPHSSEARDPPNGLLDMTLLEKRQDWFRECVQIAQIMDQSAEARHVETVKYWQSPTLGFSSDQFDEFWQTMVCGRDYQGNRASTLFAKRLLAWANFINSPRLAGNAAWAAEYSSAASSIEQALNTFVRRRRFCVTRNGRFGWAPLGAQAEDLICVLHGGSVPFVLRPTRAGYELIGDAYVSGWMKGTFLKLILMQEQEFDLI